MKSLTGAPNTGGKKSPPEAGSSPPDRESRWWLTITPNSRIFRTKTEKELAKRTGLSLDVPDLLLLAHDNQHIAVLEDEVRLRNHGQFVGEHILDGDNLDVVA